MSNLENNVETQEWTPELLQRLVAVDQGFYAYATSATLTVSKTRDAIRNRIGNLQEPASAPINMAARNQIIDLIARALPSDLRNERVISMMDFRPYFYQIATGNASFNYRVPPGNPLALDHRGLADYMLQQANIEAETFAFDATVGQPLSQQEREAIAAEALQFDPALATQNQAAKFATAQEELAGEETVVWDGNLPSMYEQQTNEPTFDVNGLRMLVKEGLIGLDTLIEREALFNEEQGTPGQMRQFFRVEQGATPIGQRMFMGANTPGGGQKLSVLATMGFLDGLTDSDYINFQEQLSRAGYDARVGKQMRRGYRDDEATQAAWLELMRDGYAQNKPLETVLVQKAADVARYQRSQWQEVQQSQSLAAVINQVSRKIIDRDLNAQEFGAVYKAFAALQQQRMGEPALGLDASYDPTTGLSEADIEQTVYNATSEERQFSPERMLQWTKNNIEYWGLPGLPPELEQRMQQFAVPPAQTNRGLEVMERRRQLEESGEI